MQEFDAVIHTVGTLIEGIDYKAAFEGRINNINPLQILNTIAGGASGNNIKYDDTHEAKNRDACKLIAEHYNNARRNLDKPGHFVFLSASKSIAPMLSRYTEMKEQAESFLLHNCPHLIPVILKPGFVWHPSERQWSMPLKLATDLGYQVNRSVVSQIPGLREALSGVLPQSESINLSVLTEFIIKGAFGDLDDINTSRIWTNEAMNKLSK